MSMKTVQLPEAIKLQDHKGKKLSGYYVGKRKVETTKVESGESLLHLFKEKDGTEVEIWSFDMLKRKLSRVPLGSFVEMKFTGTTTNEAGNKVHQVEIAYDDADKIKVDDE